VGRGRSHRRDGSSALKLDVPRNGDGSALPPYLTPMLGREQELSWLAERFAAGERLVTIFGPPGVGKTRLAVEAMKSARAAGSDTAFCDLSEARSPDDVALRVQTALVGGRARSASDAAALVAARLASSGATLLVLDNFEHLVDSTRSLVTTWAAATSGATIVVTSREVLRIAGECALDVAPLGLPSAVDGIETSDAGRLLLGAITRYDASAVRSADREALVRLLARLDGLPLAIEIVAPRVALLGAEAVLARLGDVLVHPVPSGARAHTLHRAMEWSWDLLDDAERRALVTCTRFRGGFSLASFEACVGEPSAVPPAALLASLRDKSLLRALPTRGAAPRFGVYVAVAEFVEQRAAATELRSAEHRQRAHFATLARSLLGRDDADAVTLLADERMNLRAAVERALDEDDGEAALTILGVLGQLADGDAAEPWVAIFARSEAHTAADVASGWAVLAHAQLCDQLGRYETAVELSERALTIAKDRGDLRLVARATVRLGGGALRLAIVDPDAALRERARRVLAEGVEAADRAGDDVSAANALTQLAMDFFDAGDLQEARRYAERAVSRADRANAPVAAAAAHSQSARIRLVLGEHLGAEVQARVAAELATAHAGATFIAYTRALLGMVQHALGRLEPAEQLYREAIAAEAQLGLSLHERYHRALLAVLLVEEHRDDEAIREIRRAECVVGRDMDQEWRALARAIVEGTVAARRSEPMDLDAALAAASEHAGAGGVARCARARDVARVLVESTRDEHALDAAPSALARPPSFEAAETLFAAFLERRAAKKGRASRPPAAPAGELLVHAEGLWFQVPGEDRVSCHARQAIRLLLAALAAARVEAPGRPLAWEEIRVAGWPGERMSAESARNRIKQSIAVLRKLGLGAHLETRDGGYLLSPTAAVKLVDGR